MSTWLEIRCSESGPSTGWGNDNCCWSDINSGPMQMALDSRSSLIKTMRSMERDAKKTGWIKTRKKGWVCPHCVQYIKDQP